MRIPIRLLFVLTAICSSVAYTSPPSPTTLQSQAFDTDPHWDSSRNRQAPDKIAHQDFGYSPSTNFAGQAKGEIGGHIQRSTIPAYYAESISPKTLDDKLGFSGTFAVPERSAAGICFGFFNSHQQDGSGRPVQSLILDIGFKSAGGHLAIHLINSANQSCGTMVTPVIKPKPRGSDASQRLALRPDGTRYSFNLTYDPAANSNNGQVHFMVHSNSKAPGSFEDKDFTLDLPPGFKQQNATFDRFGLLNIMKSGGTATIYFDDLTYNGKSEDFSSDPHWTESGNRGDFTEKDQVGVQNFGYSPDTQFASGKSKGEVGGSFWRSEEHWAFYADKIPAPLNLNDRLEAHGKIILLVGAPDSACHFGFFSNNDKEASPVHTANFLGVSIGGPTRIGHYFSPFYIDSVGNSAHLKSAPVLVPNKPHDFSLVYDPAGNNNQGALTVTLDQESTTLNLKPSARSDGASFDHFGLLTSGPGGQMVKLFLDDLRYTVRPSSH
jgi:hypothetical protein